MSRIFPVLSKTKDKSTNEDEEGSATFNHAERITSIKPTLTLQVTPIMQNMGGASALFRESVESLRGFGNVARAPYRLHRRDSGQGENGVWSIIGVIVGQLSCQLGPFVMD